MNHYKGWSYPELFELKGNQYIGMMDNIVITLDSTGTKIISPVTVEMVSTKENPDEYLKEEIEKYIDNLNA